MKKSISLIVLLAPTLSITIPTPIDRAQRRINAFIIRQAAAKQRSQQPLVTQLTNGDEERYADKRGNFSKSLPHDADGFVITSAYDQLVRALEIGSSAGFSTIPMGTSPVQKKLVDPQAAYMYSLESDDAWINSMVAPPAITTAQAAGEMVELYAMALFRDVNFNAYISATPLQVQVLASLNALSQFQGPKTATGLVAYTTLFRGGTPGDLTGPYISQFLYLPVPYGPSVNYNGNGLAISRKYQEQVVPTSGTTNDFITSFATWLPIQNGANPTLSTTYADTTKFIRNGRDLAEYVRFDTPPQAWVNAALIINSYGPAALDPNNPYLNNPTQAGFVEYALPDVLCLVGQAAQKALEAAWYQKWLVHRRLRPEYFGFLIDRQKNGIYNFDIDDEVMNSALLTTVFTTYGSYFLPQAYPEAAPSHPSYPSGHAAYAGAAVTILKAFFNENFVLPFTVQPNITNTALAPFTSPSLTVGGELNKLASNIGMGRDFAGIHYRTDCHDGLLLGESIALALLEDESFTRNVNFTGYTVTKFDGTKVTIGAKKTVVS